MLNNITNFFNLIATKKVKTQLDATDLLAIGTKDLRFSGNYQPTLIEYSNLASQILAGPITVGVTSIASGAVGRLLFEGTGNVLGESANLFWDNTNSRLGIGGTPGAFTLDVTGTARVQGNLIATGTGYISPISTIGTYTAFSTFNVVNDGPASIAVDRFSNNSTSPHFNLRKSRGTTTAPLIVQTNDELGYVGFWGHDGTSFQRNGIILVQAQNVAGTTITPLMRFGVGTSTAANQYGITLTSSWNTIIGSYSSDTGEKLQVIGNAKITGSLDLFSATSAGAGAEYFYLDNDPNLSAGANNQTIALMRLRDRGSNGAFTGVNRLGIVMENTAGGQYPFQLFSESGNIRIGYSTIATSSASVSIRGNTNDSSTLTINATANNDSATLRAFNSNQVIIGAGGTLSASATLQVESTTRGFLPPRMTSAQRTAIATPATGLMVYQTDGTEGLYIYKSTGWVLNS